MISVVGMWLRILFSKIKNKTHEDMHRMACGWSGSADLPAALLETEESDRESDLNFSVRSRTRMKWMGLIHRIGR